jgi:hypothetical protein
MMVVALYIDKSVMRLNVANSTIEAQQSDQAFGSGFQSLHRQ